MEDNSSISAAAASEGYVLGALIPVPCDDPIPFNTLDLDLLAEYAAAAAGLLTNRACMSHRVPH